MPNLPPQVRLATPPDIRLVQSFTFWQYSVLIDWQLLDDGTLDDTQALCTAVVVALGTDALASLEDLLPDPDSTDRAGWWGDMDAEEIWNGWDIGSKLWLLRRSAILPSESFVGATLTWVGTYIYNALQPFVTRRICSGFEITSIREDKQRIDATIQIYRGPRTAVELQYQVLWQGIKP
jgi:phage gp46-like protein